MAQGMFRNGDARVAGPALGARSAPTLRDQFNESRPCDVVVG
jgi:hypothetical protein